MENNQKNSSDFLSKLKESLETGKPNEELKKSIIDVAEKSKSVSLKDVEKAITERLNKSGVRALTEAENELRNKSIEEIQEFNNSIIEEFREEDNKWLMLSDIENTKYELIILKEEYRKVCEKYEKNIEDLSDKILNLQKDFTDNYGEDDLNILDK